MEQKIPPHREEVDELKLCWDKCFDLERYDSVELDPVITQQIKQKPQDTEETLPLPQQQLLNQSTLSHQKHSLETKKPSSKSREDYEHRIRILENQNAELMKVNKQWDQHFRFMKQTYENKSKDEYNLELHKLQEENYMLIKQNYLLRKRNDNYEREIKRLHKATSYEDLKIKNEVLMQQVKIYQEDFNKEKAEKEKIRKEKEELQQMIKRSRIQIHDKPDYQWYVPGQLPPDVRQKDTGPSLK